MRRWVREMVNKKPEDVPQLTAALKRDSLKRKQEQLRRSVEQSAHMRKVHEEEKRRRRLEERRDRRKRKSGNVVDEGSDDGDASVTTSEEA